MPLLRLRIPGPVLLLPALLCAGAASAVDQPSNYPGCATREVSVPWGGSVRVDLSRCHAFGLGIVSQAPAHGSTSPGDSEPVDSYTYHHRGQAPAGGGSDRFVVLDDASDRITVTVTILAPATAPALTVSPGTLPPLFAGTPVEDRFVASGGTAPYTYRIETGALPAGVHLQADGRLTGTPTERGPFGFDLQVRDARGGSARASHGGSVAAAPLALAATAAGFDAGRPFSLALDATGGLAPHSFQLEPGAAQPAGVALSPEGVLSGAASATPGHYRLSLRVTDSSRGTGEHFELETFRLVLGPPTVSLSVHPAAVAEDGGEALVFRVQLDAPRTTDTVVNLAPSPLPGAPSSVTIPAGATAARLLVAPQADRQPEPDETVTFALAAGPGYALAETARARGTIRNDDRP